MMRVIFIFIFVLILSLSVGVYAQNGKRDPFKSLLPEKERPEITPVEERPVAIEEIPPPNITITGVLWGTPNPRAIINGDVYGVGDIVAGTGVKVFKIEKNNVLVIHQGAVFKLGTKK